MNTTKTYTTKVNELQLANIKKLVNSFENVPNVGIVLVEDEVYFTWSCTSVNSDEFKTRAFAARRELALLCTNIEGVKTFKAKNNGDTWWGLGGESDPFGQFSSYRIGLRFRQA